jgi:transposase
VGIVEEQIAEAMKEHPDASLFTELPGAGPVLAARLLAAFGSDRGRYESAENLQRLSGVAPVLERSGKTSRVRWRMLAPQFLRQTFVEWARCTTRVSAWAAAYHEEQLEKGKGNWAIYRSLAYKWIRILWKCWQDRKPYNETEYLKALERRNSPLARRLKTMAA